MQACNYTVYKLITILQLVSRVTYKLLTYDFLLLSRIINLLIKLIYLTTFCIASESSSDNL